MSAFSRGARRVLGNAPRPAWIRCPGQHSFCCCFTVRTGASIVGWFDFLFNALYIGMMVFALARATEQLDSHIFKLTSATASNREDAEGSGNSFTLPPNHNSSNEADKFPLSYFSLCKGTNGDLNALSKCIHQAETITVINSTARDCSFLPDGYEHSDCMCSLGYISLRAVSDVQYLVALSFIGHTWQHSLILVRYRIMPMMYQSLGIPGFMLVLATLWLTAVESNTIKFIRAVGYTFVIAIPIQLILQFYYQIYAGNQLRDCHLNSLHWMVWFVYGIYSILNIYYLLVLTRYIKLRTKECAQGIEQGLLTSERNPPSSRALDVYLEDAFSIDAEVGYDRVCYSIDDNDDDDNEDANQENNVVEYDFTKRYEEVELPPPMIPTLDTTQNSTTSDPF